MMQKHPDIRPAAHLASPTQLRDRPVDIARLDRAIEILALPVPTRHPMVLALTGIAMMRTAFGRARRMPGSEAAIAACRHFILAGIDQVVAAPAYAPAAVDAPPCTPAGIANSVREALYLGWPDRGPDPPPIGDIIYFSGGIACVGVGAWIASLPPAPPGVRWAATQRARRLVAAAIDGHLAAPPTARDLATANAHARRQRAGRAAGPAVS